MSLVFGSWCSGIEAASEAFLPLGWKCAYVAEIEPFPCAYLAQRHGAGRPVYMPRPEAADTPHGARERKAAIKALAKIAWGASLTNYGDISQIAAADLPPVDILAAGFPCQDFSIAGLRASLSGDRGSISTTGVRLLLECAKLGLVRGAILEQVPDVLNTIDNAWGNILGALVGADAALEGLPNAKPGQPERLGKWPRAGMVAGPRARVAWRILDAQHFGLAQRRERVWAVVDFGDGPDPAAVLFERKGVSGHPASRAQPREGVAPTLAGGARKRGGFSYDDVPQVPAGAQRRAAFRGNNTSGPINIATARTASHTASGRQDFESETFIAEGPVAYSIMPQNSGKDYKAREVDIAQPLMASGPVGGNQGGDYVVAPIAFNARQDPISGPVVGPVDTDGGTHAIAFSLRGREGGAMAEVEPNDLVPSLRAADGGSTRPFIAFDETQITSPANRISPKPGQPTHPLTSTGRPPTLAAPMAVRRITVVEAERLQGFADNATLIRWPSVKRRGEDLPQTLTYLAEHGFPADMAEMLAMTPDGPRYRAIGNSWPVPVARWLGERIALHLPPRAA